MTQYPVINGQKVIGIYKGDNNNQPVKVIELLTNRSGVITPLFSAQEEHTHYFNWSNEDAIRYEAAGNPGADDYDPNLYHGQHYAVVQCECGAEEKKLEDHGSPLGWDEQWIDGYLYSVCKACGYMKLNS